ncbi:MAG: cytochrome b N-terminal domain-containing protein [Chloroflexi bacterium]|nr:cytochrome b N-terminal domain-containing protein [Chloroflexota bacterium]
MARPEEIQLRGSISPTSGRLTLWWDSTWRGLDERLGLSAFSYPVPEYANRLPYLLGGITLMGFIILFATGVWLAQFYHPHPSEAHSSVVFIITQAPLGDIVRSLHYWGANIVVLTVLLHMMRIYWAASYKRPREGNWLIGVGLLAVTTGLIFTGTVLKYDQEGFEALAHNREVANLLGFLGSWFSLEFSLSVPLLTRLYIGHITILPGLFTLLILGHLFLIKYHSISPRPSDEPAAVPERMSRFTVHLRRMIGFGLLLWAGLGVLSVLAPAPLGLPAVPGEEVTKPPWMFLWLYPLENVWGVQGLFYGGLLFFALLALVPFVDRSPYRSPRRRRWLLAAGGILFLALVVLGLYAWATVPVAHLVE